MADQDMDAQWKEYKEKFGKVYEPEEDKMRRDLWEQTLKKIETHNKEADEGKHTWWMGVNQFTDKRPEEVCCGGLRPCRRPNKEEAHSEGH